MPVRNFCLIDWNQDKYSSPLSPQFHLFYHKVCILGNGENSAILSSQYTAKNFFNFRSFFPVIRYSKPNEIFVIVKNIRNICKVRLRASPTTRRNVRCAPMAGRAHYVD